MAHLGLTVIYLNMGIYLMSTTISGEYPEPR